MTVPPYEPKPELTTERVASGRWKAVAVLAVAVIIVGGLAWKPWDHPSSPVPTPTLAASAHPTATPDSASYVAPDNPTIIAPEPTPDIEPPPTIGPATSGDPGEGVVGTVSLDNGLEGYVECIYRMNTDPPHLSEVFVNAPQITIGNGTAAEPLRALSWTAVLESNGLSEIFEADWQPLDVSATHTFALHGRRSVSFKPVIFDVGSIALAPSQVLRVTVLVNWLGAHGKRLSQTSVVANSYATDSDLTAIVPEGCSSELQVAHF